MAPMGPIGAHRGWDVFGRGRFPGRCPWLTSCAPLALGRTCACSLSTAYRLLRHSGLRLKMPQGTTGFAGLTAPSSRFRTAVTVRPVNLAASLVVTVPSSSSSAGFHTIGGLLIVCFFRFRGCWQTFFQCLAVAKSTPHIAATASADSIRTALASAL